MSIQEKQVEYINKLNKIPIKELENYIQDDETKFLLVFGTRIIDRCNTFEDAVKKMKEAPFIIAIISPKNQKEDEEVITTDN